jgi:hypothetical protein
VGNLLASPGRIKKSPKLASRKHSPANIKGKTLNNNVNSNNNPVVAAAATSRKGGWTPGGTTFIPPQRTPPTPNKPLGRKKSL